MEGISAGIRGGPPDDPDPDRPELPNKSNCLGTWPGAYTEISFNLAGPAGGVKEVACEGDVVPCGGMRSAGLALVVTLVGCAPRSEILVVLSTDLDLPREADKLGLTITY